MPARYYARVEHPRLRTPVPIFGRLVSEEGSHDLLEMSWTRPSTGYLPLMKELKVRSPISVRFGRASGSTVTTEYWFHGYVTDLAPSARGVILTALSSTERFKDVHTRYLSDGLLSSLLNQVVDASAAGYRSVLDGPDVYVCGVFQDDSDWSLLNKLADQYGYALVTRPGQVILRDRSAKVFGRPAIVQSRNQKGGTGHGWWHMIPVRSMSANRLDTYVAANVDPRTGVPFSVAVTPPLASERRRQVVLASVDEKDAQTTLDGTLCDARYSDRATGVVVEGAFDIRPGNVIQSATGRDDLDGIWWVCRTEHTFGGSEMGTTALEMVRPVGGWAPTTAVRSDPGFYVRPRLVNSSWRWST